MATMDSLGGESRTPPREREVKGVWMSPERVEGRLIEEMKRKKKMSNSKQRRLEKRRLERAEIVDLSNEDEIGNSTTDKKRKKTEKRRKVKEGRKKRKREQREQRMAAYQATQESNDGIPQAHKRRRAEENADDCATEDHRTTTQEDCPEKAERVKITEESNSRGLSRYEMLCKKKRVFELLGINEDDLDQAVEEEQTRHKRERKSATEAASNTNAQEETKAGASEEINGTLHEKTAEQAKKPKRKKRKGTKTTNQRTNASSDPPRVVIILD